VHRIGQVGYGVRPSARGRGHATWALGQVLSSAATDGLHRLLVVCADEGVLRRYWIPLDRLRPGQRTDRIRATESAPSTVNSPATENSTP
jgi:hypothetical protein